MAISKVCCFEIPHTPKHLTCHVTHVNSSSHPTHHSHILNTIAYRLYITYMYTSHTKSTTHELYSGFKIDTRIVLTHELSYERTHMYTHQKSTVNTTMGVNTQLPLDASQAYMSAPVIDVSPP